MSLVKDLNDSYGIRIRKREKIHDVKRMTVADGRLLCWKPYTFEEPDVGFIARVLRRLEEAGYDRSPQLVSAKDGSDYIKCRGGFGILSNWVAGRRPIFSDRDEWRTGLRELARFHKKADGLPDEDVPEGRVRYHKLGRLAADCRKEFQAHSGLRRFEDLCGQGAAHLEHDLCKRALQVEKEAGAFVHGDFNFPNLILDRKRHLHLIDLENTSMQARMTDFAHLLYRNKSFDADGVLSAVDIYDRRRPLSSADRYLLYALLHVPYPVIRQMRRFGKRFKQRAEMPSSNAAERFTRKLRKLVE